jgi:hypothetical protein
MASLDALVARIETNVTEPHERLDSAIQRWSAASHAELSRTIPSTQVMANIADLGAFMLAATHHLHSLRPETTAKHLQDVTERLRSGAEALKAASTGWKSVSTLQPQSREFGAASLELFDVMREVITSTAALERGRATTLDVDQALHRLARGVDDLTHFMGRAHDATRACLNSGLLVGPARSLPASTDRLTMAQRRAYISLKPCDAQGLITVLANATDLPHHLPGVAVPAPHIALSR